MTTTKQRIDADIKKNVSPLIAGLVADLLAREIQEIAEGATELSGKLQNLCDTESKAGEVELVTAIEIIEQKIAKELVEKLKKTYSLK